MLLKYNVISKCIDLLENERNEIVTRALTILGNLLTGGQEQTKCLISHGFIPHLAKLVSHSNKMIRKIALVALSYIAAELPDEIQCLIDAGVFLVLFERIPCEEFDIRKEILWTFHNALCSGNDDQMKYLIDAGVVPFICQMAAVEVDESVIKLALDALELALGCGYRLDKLAEVNHLIEGCGGLDKLEALTDHPSDEVYKRAYNLIERYFGVDDEGVELDSLIMDEQVMDLFQEMSDQIL